MRLVCMIAATAGGFAGEVSAGGDQVQYTHREDTGYYDEEQHHVRRRHVPGSIIPEQNRGMKNPGTGSSASARPSAETPSPPPVRSSHRVLHVVPSLKDPGPVDIMVPNKAHTRAVMVGPGEGSGSRSTCGRNPYSRMGACASHAPSDRSIQALPDGAGPLLPAVFNMTAEGLMVQPRRVPA
jgi:hypothetical protein